MSAVAAAPLEEREFRVISRDIIRQALPLETCIELMAEAMQFVSRRRVVMPLRTIMHLPGSDDHLGIMPGYVEDLSAWGTKLICLLPGNPAKGLSTHNGAVLLHDRETGHLRAVLDAAEITALRTPATTAMASRALARADASRLAILGTGEQALAHLEAMLMVHPVTQVKVWGRSRERTERMIERARSFSDIPITACETVREAVDGADIICTATAATDPILKGEWIAPGTHINLVGASVADRSEIDGPGVAKARYFVDYRPSAEAQAGELLGAVAAGLVALDHIVGEIGQVLLGEVRGRLNSRDITIYKSLGVSAQDIVAADAIYRRACASGLGQKALL